MEFAPPPSEAPAEDESAAAIAELSALTTELRQGLEAARASVESARREALSSSETELVRLAMAIAEKVVGRELSVDPSVVGLWAREGLTALGAEDSVRCVVSPRVGEVLVSLQGWFGDGDMPDVVVDSRMHGLSCEIRGRYGKVDEGLQSRLDAVAATLGLEEKSPP